MRSREEIEQKRGEIQIELKKSWVNDASKIDWGAGYIKALDWGEENEEEVKQKIKEVETELHDDYTDMDTDEINFDYGFIEALKWMLGDAPRNEKEPLNVIEFAKDYKKLHCSIGGIFTTIRRDNDENAERFEEHEGEIFQVKVEGKDAFKARLLLKSPNEKFRLTDFSIAFLEYDTDDHIEDLQERYGHDKVIMLIFQRMGD